MMHDYLNGHSCAGCGTTGIHCSIEDGNCDWDGECDRCLRASIMRQIRLEERDNYNDYY